MVPSKWSQERSRSGTRGRTKRRQVGGAPCRKFVAVFFSCSLMAAGGPAIAGACAFEPQGDGRVAAVIDARSFRLEDGREVVLGRHRARSGG